MGKIDNDKMWAFLANYVPSKETERYFKELSDNCMGTTIQDVVKRMVIDGLADQELLCRNSDAKEMKGNGGKFSPKFKPDDWVVWDGLTYHINDVTYNGYCCNEVFIIFSEEKDMHLWTIEDAEDGDVLVESERNIILMFRRIGNTEWDDVIDYHCYYDCYQEDFIVQKDVDYWGNTEDNQLEPATKEQRDLLFSKMKEDGYEWDGEKKELKKIEQKSDEIEGIEHVEHGKYYYCIKDYYSGGCKRASKGEVVQALRGMSMMALGVKANEYFIPVKYITGDRPAWSKEDKINIDEIIETLNIVQANRLRTQRTHYSKATIDKDIAFLKSIKERIGNFDDGYKVGFSAAKHNHWKPSDKQIQVIDEIIGDLGRSQNSTHRLFLYETLREIRNQLNKLKKN